MLEKENRRKSKEDKTISFPVDEVVTAFEQMKKDPNRTEKERNEVQAAIDALRKTQPEKDE